MPADALISNEIDLFAVAPGWAKWTRVYITSNSQPEDWYPTPHGQMPDVEGMKGLRRRLGGLMGEINHFTVVYVPPVVAAVDDGIEVLI